MNWTPIIACALLLTLPSGAAWLLRLAGLRRAAIAGGVAAGVLLGPSVLGRAAPVFHETAFEGGAEQRSALRSLERRRAADELAARWAGLDDDERARWSATVDAEREPLQRALDAAAWNDQRLVRGLALGLVALVLAGSSLSAPRTSGARPGALAATNIGLWSAALPGALAWLALTWWEREPAVALMAAAAIAIGPAGLAADDATAADRAEVGGARLITAAGRLATIAAIIAAGWALWWARGWPACLLVATLLPALIRGAKSVRVRQWAGSVVERLLLPAAAACAMSRVDALTDWTIGPLVVLVLLCGDGRWLGAFVGAMLPGGRRALRTVRLVMGAAGGAASQVAMITLAAYSWTMPGPIALALIAGALLMELTADARRSIAERLEAAEVELGEDDPPRD